MSESRLRRGFKLGCLGVVALVVLLVAWTGSVFVTAYMRARNEVVAVKELARELPPAPEGSGETPVAGRVILDFTVGEWQVRPGEPGEPIRVAAEFDERSYALTETWEVGERGSWIYRLTFEETSWFKDGGLRALLGGSFPRIEVSLPPDMPLALEGRFAKGGSSLHLGGLWLTEIELDAEKGGFDIYFAEPLARPLERMRVHAKQGGASLRGIGNASPRVLEVDHRMGGMRIDLRGQWVRDAEVRILSSMGNGQVILPRDVVVEGLGDRGLRLRPPDKEEIPLPRVRISISESFGKVQVTE